MLLRQGCGRETHRGPEVSRKAWELAHARVHEIDMAGPLRELLRAD